MSAPAHPPPLPSTPPPPGPQEQVVKPFNAPAARRLSDPTVPSGNLGDFSEKFPHSAVTHGSETLVSDENISVVVASL